MTHVWENTNLRRIDEQREHIEQKECHYNGTIEYDEKSRVAVSLCDGMVSSLIIRENPYKALDDLDMKYRLHDY